MIHTQGDHLFNDWRVAFDDLDQRVQSATGKPHIAARIAAVFAPFRSALKVEEARGLTIKCVGHPDDYDQNSIHFGELMRRFRMELVNYVLTRSVGVMSDGANFLRKGDLVRAFRRLTESSIDEDAVGRYLAAYPAQAKLIASIKSYYAREAPQAFETLLNRAWEPPGF